MQLTANFVVLATALAYSSTSVLALPVSTSFAAREVDYDLEARDVQDEVSFAAREVPEMFLDARSFFDSEEYDARDVASTPAPVTASVPNTPVTPVSAVTPATPATPATPVTPVTPVSAAAPATLASSSTSTGESKEAKHAAYRKALAAGPSDPLYAEALKHQEKRKAFLKALVNKKDPEHEAAVEKQQKAYKDKTDPHHKQAVRVEHALKKHAAKKALARKHRNRLAKHTLKGSRKHSEQSLLEESQGTEHRHRHHHHSKEGEEGRHHRHHSKGKKGDKEALKEKKGSTTSASSASPTATGAATATGTGAATVSASPAANAVPTGTA